MADRQLAVMDRAAGRSSSRPGWWSWASGDVVAGVVLAAIAAPYAAYLMVGGTIVGTDAAVPLYPLYGLLGERLGAGEWPWWDPYVLSGLPLAADPQSGWLYLPVMLLFGVLPLAAAANALLLLHIVLAVAGVYVLARTLRIPPIGGAVAAYLYVANTWYTQRLPCCPVDIAVASWLPWPLLGAEQAIAARAWPARVGWWSLAGLALSQILSVWLGQGAYYAALAVAAFVVYRTVVDPPVGTADWRRRLTAAAMHGLAIFGIGFGLAAGGILPRLEYIARSNLADGYREDVAGGWTWFRIGERLVGLTSYYVGTGALLLALLALVIVRRRHAAPFWVALALLAMVFAGSQRSPVHAVLYALLPRFEDLQSHLPQRVLLVFFLAIALLAGGAVGTVATWRDDRYGRWIMLAIALGFVRYAFWVDERAARVSERVLLPLGIVAVVVVVLTIVPAGWWRRAAPLVTGLLVLTLGVDLFFASRTVQRDALAVGALVRMDLAASDDDAGAGAFLQDATAADPARFFGYDPAVVTADPAAEIRYRTAFASDETAELLVNDRALLLGLQDVQASNLPVQLERYVQYMDALNERSQDYHDANVYPAGLNSPLLDLLNARYIIVPNVAVPDRSDLQALYARFPTVYADEDVRVLENPDALPRAWIVHDARQIEPGTALPILADGTVDPRRTALLETAPPPLAVPPDPAADRATIAAYAPERIQVDTFTGAPGLLVLSEIAYPAWRAYVDGEPAELYLADHTLRAVAVPAGAHTVELRYESTPLRVGLAITGATAVGVLAALGGAALAVYRGAGETAAAGGRVGRSRPPRRRRVSPRSRIQVTRQKSQITATIAPVRDAIATPSRSEDGS